VAGLPAKHPFLTDTVLWLIRTDRGIEFQADGAEHRKARDVLCDIVSVSLD